ncbi:CcmD family protein [Candidatus Zixiibacteriota bacterium]
MSSNYIVMIVTLLTWAGLFVYLLKIDRALKHRENK